MPVSGEDIRQLFGSFRTKQDYDRLEQEFQLRKQQAALQNQAMAREGMITPAQQAQMDLERQRLSQQSSIANMSPSAVREYEYYNKLTPEQQQVFLGVKRSNQVVNTGDAQTVIDRATGMPAISIPINPSPESLPSFKREQAKATASGSVEGKGEITPKDQSQRSRENASKMISSMKEDFIKLGEMGAIVDETKGTAPNIAASIGASPIGQFTGKITGDEAQTIRKQIDDMKPKLLLAIMQAGGASAKALDSNAELAQWLRTVGDTSSSLQSNLTNLDRINEIIGLSEQPSGGIINWEDLP